MLAWPVAIVFRFFDGQQLLKDGQNLDNEGFLNKIREEDLTPFPTEFAKKISEIYGATDKNPNTAVGRVRWEKNPNIAIGSTGCASTAVPLDIQNKPEETPQPDENGEDDERIICLD